jgi:hypothetical protein
MKKILFYNQHCFMLENKMNLFGIQIFIQTHQIEPWKFKFFSLKFFHCHQIEISLSEFSYLNSNRTKIFKSKAFTSQKLIWNISLTDYLQNKQKFLLLPTKLNFLLLPFLCWPSPLLFNIQHKLSESELSVQ